MVRKTIKDYAWVSSNYYYFEEKRIDPGGKMDSPILDLYETHGEIAVEIDVPGIDPRYLSIKIANNLLTIEGKRVQREEEGVNYLRMERCHDDFKRMVQLPAAVDSHRARARYERGVLIIFFPKINERRKEEISIIVE